MAFSFIIVAFPSQAFNFYFKHLSPRSPSLLSLRISNTVSRRPVSQRRLTSSRASNDNDSEESSGKNSSAVTFFLSPMSLTHLSYFDDASRNIPPPKYDLTLVSDDNDLTDEAAATLTIRQPQQADISDFVSAKLPALAASIASALFFGYGANYVLENNMHLDLLGAGPLLYFLGFSTAWQVMGGDMEVEASGRASMASTDALGSMDKNKSVDDEAIRFVMDRPIRLRSILGSLKGADAVIVTAPDNRDLSKANKYLTGAHTQKYIDTLRSACSSMPYSSSGGESAPIRRLSLGSSRTFIDYTSFGAAVSAVQDWIDAVDHVISNDAPAFALTRPPSHHACPTRGMGGCLLNGCAVAACYALKAYPDVRRVSILDIDAHHGNGIAACIQDRPPIRYCSIHEYCRGEAASLREPRADNPRGPMEGDCGPRMNCMNVVLPPDAGWDSKGSYEYALVERALPFLTEKNPELLLVACGFDALDEDRTSSLKLKPIDYRHIGEEIKKEFGNRVVFGLEGGYCYDKGTVLGDSILEITRPWIS